ncbi:MAG TPA: 23S rRNA (adenine(2503)-C(2))-methyltransferase RlmN, partial [Candidatus Polarisedimenticolaceae bacterium]|nr:23S rRNA (adenine(2503)-C(2))-methyltransferase RlmN [Candidatus Polarisedimenticolaceae bacterium]
MSRADVPRGKARTNLYGLDRPGLAQSVERGGLPVYHAGQIFRWIYHRHELDPRNWTDLSNSLRERLALETVVDPGRIADRVTARDRTVKYRVVLPDGKAVEAVYMEQRSRVTLCISSQVGCALACDFCLTGKMGLVRQLTPGEIVGQVALIRRERELDQRAFNIVFMGMGEPLHNYDALTAAIRLLVDPQGFGLSRRRITVSTAGLAPAIERLGDERHRPRLAVSLNATTDELRSRLMPINRRYPIARLLEACRRFADRSKERFTLEYVLLSGVNDGDDEIDRLAGIVRSVPAKLNLIPFNPVDEWLDYRPPERARVLRARDRLLAARVPVSIRWSRGVEA